MSEPVVEAERTLKQAVEYEVAARLVKYNWNKSRAAHSLKIDRRTLSTFCSKRKWTLDIAKAIAQGKH